LHSTNHSTQTGGKYQYYTQFHKTFLSSKMNGTNGTVASNTNTMVQMTFQRHKRFKDDQKIEQIYGKGIIGYTNAGI